MKKYLFTLVMLMTTVLVSAQVPYYAGSQGGGQTYTYLSTKFHPGHNDQQVYFAIQHGLTDYLDLATDVTVGNGWSYQGFGARFNAIQSDYFSLGGQVMVDFNTQDNYKYDYTCGSLYMNGNIVSTLHWVSNTWYTIYKGHTKNTVDQWTYLGFTIDRFTPMIGAITSCTDDWKTDLAVGCYTSIGGSSYLYLWGSGLTNNVYYPRIVIGFDYKF